jgi:hypothetical protein
MIIGMLTTVFVAWIVSSPASEAAAISAADRSSRGTMPARQLTS